MHDESFDVLVIGSGLSGLTAGRTARPSANLKVLCVEQHTHRAVPASIPDRRKDDRPRNRHFFGFGSEGFNPHRYVMDLLGQPIDVLRHRYMYRWSTVVIRSSSMPISMRTSVSWRPLFPDEIEDIKRFYAYIGDLYHHVIAADKTYMAPTEIPKAEALGRFACHPVRNVRLLALLSKSAGDLLRKFVDSERVVRFFSKLTSTYCYTTLDETPAILAITMFMENHIGGSYYAVGGSQPTSGKA